MGDRAVGDPVRVLLADDDGLLRGTVRLLVDATDGMTVVGEAATGREAVDLAARHDPDLVLMDVRMPGLDGIAATERIVAAGGRCRVLVLTTFDLDDYVYRALRAGACGFLLKGVPAGRLVEAITLAVAGEALLAPSVTRRLIETYTRGRRPDPSAIDGVTTRETEVLTLITRGLSNTEIERALHVSRGTVKTHVGRLMAKLHARDRAQLVIAGYEAGLADR